MKVLTFDTARRRSADIVAYGRPRQVHVPSPSMPRVTLLEKDVSGHGETTGI